MDNPPAVDAYLQDFQRWLLATDFSLAKGRGECWEGTLHIEWQEIESGDFSSADHRVAIELPPGFPYRKPNVYSLDDPALIPSWHLTPSGSLCLWREPDGWNPFMSGQKLIARIREWFIYYHTGEWPEDFAPSDLHLYLKNEGLVVIGDEWISSSEQKEGKFILWLNKKFRFQPGLVGLRSDLQGKAEPEKRLIDSLGWQKDNTQSYNGVWIRVCEPFVPSDRLDSLLDQIDQIRGDPSGKALKFLEASLNRHSLSNGIPIAIGYPGVEGQERWLFLWAVKPIGKTFHLSNSDQRHTIEIHSFETAPARKSDLLRRTIHLSKNIEHKRIAIFGIGALGSNVAILLAKAGLGEIRLVDSDQIRPSNAIRHESGINWTGFPKTLSVGRIILQHNPDCTTSEYVETWQKDEIKAILKDVDLAIDVTANIVFSLWLNQIIIETPIPTLFASAYRRASIGRLVLRRTAVRYDDPCLACYLLNGEKWGVNQYPIIPLDATALFEEEGCISVTEEADAINIGIIACQIAKTSIQFLTGEVIKANLFLQVNDPLIDSSDLLSIPGFHPLLNHSLNECPICKPARGKH